MKLSDIVTEQQLDELDVAGGLARGLGAVAKGAGAVAGAGVGAIDAVKSGFSAGRAAVGGYKAPTAAPQDAGIDGTLNVQQLAKLLPGIDAAALAKAVAVIKAGGEPSVSQQKALSGAFTGLLQADPQATTQAMSLLKKVSAEPADQQQAEPAAGQTAPAKADPSAQARINAAPQGYDGETGKPNAAPVPGKTDPAADTTQAAAPQTPDQIRAAKQADAATTAQDQMAANPAAPKPAADPGANAFGQMANTLTKEPAAGQATTTPVATTPPAGSDKMTPQQIAALKGKLKGGAGATSASSNFGKYVDKASGERIVGANKDGSVKTVNIKASKINTGNNLSEMLAANIEKQKKRIAEERAANYKNSSIFTK